MNKNTFKEKGFKIDTCLLFGGIFVKFVKFKYHKESISGVNNHHS